MADLRSDELLELLGLKSGKTVSGFQPRSDFLLVDKPLPEDGYEVNPQYYFVIGETRRVEGKYDEAISYYDLAIRFDGRHAGAYNSRGMCHFNLGRLEDALQDFNTAVDVDRDDHTAWRNKALTLEQLGRYEDALDSMRIAFRQKACLLYQQDCERILNWDRQHKMSQTEKALLGEAGSEDVPPE